MANITVSSPVDTFMQSATLSAARTNLEIDYVVTVDQYGAVGDGVTDDTTAIQSAVDSGAGKVIIPAGTYLVSQVTVTSAVSIEVLGTLKQKAASSGSIIYINGTSNVQVIGGIFDGNKAAGHTGNQYGMAAVYVNNSTDVLVDRVISRNSYGSGFLIKQSDNVIIQNCKAEATTAEFGLYAEPLLTGTNNTSYGLIIKDNEFRTTSTSSGIVYIASDSDNASGDNNWTERCTITGNKVYAPSGSEAAATNTNVPITYRAKQGVITNNYIEYGSIGISCDWASDTVVSNNVVVDAWLYFYEIKEIDNARTSACIISNNTGYKSGTAASNGLLVSSGYTGADDISGLVVSGNNFTNVDIGINIASSGSGTGSFTDVAITGNAINDAESYGIRLRRVYGATICGNCIRLDDPTNAAGNGVFLDAECQGISITGNKFDDGLRALQMSGAGATYKDIVLAHNIVNMAQTIIVSTGTASTGIIVGPNGGTDWDSAKVTYDYANDRFFLWNNAYTTPEGNLTAGVGSTYTTTTNGATFRKRTGTGNTGWALEYGGIAAAADGDATPSVAGKSVITINNTTPTTITDFDDGLDGQDLRVEIEDANTTIDFTGTNLNGNAGVDWTAAAGDAMIGFKRGTDWYFQIVDTTV